MYTVYMIKDNENRLYVGISRDPTQRLKAHNSKKGAHFTHSGNFQIVFKEVHSTLKNARSREVQIKRWRRSKKDFLIDRYKKGLKTII